LHPCKNRAGRKKKEDIVPDSIPLVFRYVGLFFLGCFLFAYPVLTLFNLDARLFGIPLFFFYIFFAWSVLIVFIIVCGKIREPFQAGEPGKNDRDAGPPGNAGE
jgi:hypothetical protein